MEESREETRSIDKYSSWELLTAICWETGYTVDEVNLELQRRGYDPATRMLIRSILAPMLWMDIIDDDPWKEQKAPGFKEISWSISFPMFILGLPILAYGLLARFLFSDTLPGDQVVWVIGTVLCGILPVFMLINAIIALSSKIISNILHPFRSDTSPKK